MTGVVVLVMIVAVLIGVWYSRQQRSYQSGISQQLKNENTMGNTTLTSTAFGHNASIPKEYTCQGKDENPPLAISGVPADAKSLVLVIDDPDAPVGVWDHWVVWNIAPDTAEVAAHSVPAGAVQGRNSSGENKYQGPCPPFGTHRYRFTIYAISDVLSLAPGSSKQEVLTVIANKILDQYTLVGLYKKS